MGKKFHVNDENRVLECDASVRECKFDHYDTWEQANEAVAASQGHSVIASASRTVPTEDNSVPQQLESSNVPSYSFNGPYSYSNGGISGAGQFVAIDGRRFRRGDLEDPRNRFMLVNGRCGDLARAIIAVDPSREPAFVVYDIDQKTFDWNYQHGDSDASRSAIMHVVIQGERPGEYLDAYGCQSEESIKQFYPDAHILESDVALDDYHTGVPAEDLREFAESAIRMEKDHQSYSYTDFPTENYFTSQKPVVLHQQEAHYNKDRHYFSVHVPESALSERLAAWREYVGQDNADRMEQAKAQRDGAKKFHVTAFTYKDLRKLGRGGVGRVYEALSDARLDLKLEGIGTINDPDSNKETWFVKAACPELNRVRSNLRLEDKDFHVTIGFTGGDVFNRYKGYDTLVIE
jgi:hypothetical protein